MVRHRHFARPWHVAPADQPHIRDGVMGTRHGRAVTHAVRSPVRPATWWTRVVSGASARVMAGRMVVSRRVSLDFPAPGAEQEEMMVTTPTRLSTSFLHRSAHAGCAARPHRRASGGWGATPKAAAGDLRREQCRSREGGSTLATTRGMSAIAVIGSASPFAWRPRLSPCRGHRVGVQVGG
jgi:hypothetical protein